MNALVVQLRENEPQVLVEYGDFKDSLASRPDGIGK